jgi:hypothetical protein
MVATLAPQQPAGGGGLVPVFPEAQFESVPTVAPTGNGFGQLPEVVHTAIGVHNWHSPPLIQLQHPQQPAMKPHWPGLLPFELPVEIAHALNVGVATAIAVGAVIERISGAAAAAVPSFAERTASSRRVTALPLPGVTSTSSSPCSSSPHASSSSTAWRTTSSARPTSADIVLASVLPSQACHTRAASAPRQCARLLIRS